MHSRSHKWNEHHWSKGIRSHKTETFRSARKRRSNSSSIWLVAERIHRPFGTIFYRRPVRTSTSRHTPQAWNLSKSENQTRRITGITGSHQCLRHLRHSAHPSVLVKTWRVSSKSNIFLYRPRRIASPWNKAASESRARSQTALRLERTAIQHLDSNLKQVITAKMIILMQITVRIYRAVVTKIKKHFQTFSPWRMTHRRWASQPSANSKSSTRSTHPFSHLQTYTRGSIQKNEAQTLACRHILILVTHKLYGRQKSSRFKQQWEKKSWWSMRPLNYEREKPSYLTSTARPLASSAMNSKIKSTTRGKHAQTLEINPHTERQIQLYLMLQLPPNLLWNYHTPLKWASINPCQNNAKLRKYITKVHLSVAPIWKSYKSSCRVWTLMSPSRDHPWLRHCLEFSNRSRKYLQWPQSRAAQSCKSELHPHYRSLL